MPAYSVNFHLYTYTLTVVVVLARRKIAGGRMKSDSNQSLLKSLPFNDTYAEDVPLFATYLCMAVTLMLAVIVITPAAIVINIIWKTRELHTRYYFFVANLLATDVIAIIVRIVMHSFIIILYLLDFHNSHSASTILRSLVLPIFLLVNLTTLLLPVTIAIERIVVIGFPYRHRSIMTTKMVISLVGAMWGVSIVLTIMATVIVPVNNIVWPLALVDYHPTISLFFRIPRLASAAFITAANTFLQYKVFVSNRKAKENQRLGNEEEVRRFVKLAQLLRAQVKPTITLLLVGGIDVIGNIAIIIVYIVIEASVQPSEKVYLVQFLMNPIITILLASHPLVYGLYMKKIRDRLPKCTACTVQWTTRNSRVTTLHQQA